MQKPTSSKSSSKSSTTSKPARPHLPDPATEGPYRPFTTDPKWNEAWWWLGVPVLVLLLPPVTIFCSIFVVLRRHRGESGKE